MHLKFEEGSVLPHLLSFLAAALFIFSIYLKDWVLPKLKPNIKITRKHGTRELRWVYVNSRNEQRPFESAQERRRRMAENYEDGELSEFEKLTKDQREAIL